MPPLTILLKPASSRCNMRCRYCFYADEAKKRRTADYGFMSPETLEIVFRRALTYSTGHCTIAFQGGEPTLAGLDFFRRACSWSKSIMSTTVRSSMHCKRTATIWTIPGRNSLPGITFWWEFLWMDRRQFTMPTESMLQAGGLITGSCMPSSF